MISCKVPLVQLLGKKWCEEYPYTLFFFFFFFYVYFENPRDSTYALIEGSFLGRGITTGPNAQVASIPTLLWHSNVKDVLIWIWILRNNKFASTNWKHFN